MVNSIIVGLAAVVARTDNVLTVGWVAQSVVGIIVHEVVRSFVTEVVVAGKCFCGGWEDRIIDNGGNVDKKIRVNI